MMNGIDGRTLSLWEYEAMIWEWGRRHDPDAREPISAAAKSVIKGRMAAVPPSMLQ